MRKFFAFAVIAAATSGALSAEKELFSDVRTGAVFAPSAGSTTTTPAVRPGQGKVRDPEQLGRILGEAGFSAKKEDDRTASTDTVAADRSLPVEIAISEDGIRLTIALLLSVVETESTLTTKKLLALLEANRKHAPASFTYNSEVKRFEINRILANEKITANVLRNAIDGLAQIATETESLWQLDASSKTPTSEPTAEPEMTTPSLVGRWSATRSKTEAFAIQFKADNTFDLVYVNSGKQTKSSGKFSIEGTKLTLEGKASFRLAGTIKSAGDQEFQLLLENSTLAPLVFKRAK